MVFFLQHHLEDMGKASIVINNEYLRIFFTPTLLEGRVASAKAIDVPNIDN